MSQQNLVTLLDICREHPDASLVFTLNDAEINPNYHVTEIKHANVYRICSEQWSDGQAGN